MATSSSTTTSKPPPLYQDAVKTSSTPANASGLKSGLSSKASGLKSGLSSKASGLKSGLSSKASRLQNRVTRANFLKNSRIKKTEIITIVFYMIRITLVIFITKISFG